MSLLLLASCTTNVPYPDNWPDLHKNSKTKCLSFEGKYKNNNNDSYLSDLFNIEILGSKDDVTLELDIIDSETLQVSLSRPDKDAENFKITYEKNEFLCKNGVIYFKRGREYYIHQVVMATSRADVELFSSEEFLVAKLLHKSYTLAMLVLPIKNNNIKWQKWEKSN